MLPTVAMQLSQPIELSKLLYEIYFWQAAVQNCGAKRLGFTAKDFADASWTKKVDTGKVEIKGAIHELEIRPDGSAEWVFAPMKTGTFELHCSVIGHKEAGMTGQIKIVDG
jgi:uncharacterized cupredoxin-like copper-binding protein